MPSLKRIRRLRATPNTPHVNFGKNRPARAVEPHTCVVPPASRPACSGAVTGVLSTECQSAQDDVYRGQARTFAGPHSFEKQTFANFEIRNNSPRVLLRVVLRLIADSGLCRTHNLTAVE
jgi:hypothetical protein